MDIQHPHEAAIEGSESDQRTEALFKEVMALSDSFPKTFDAATRMQSDQLRLLIDFAQKKQEETGDFMRKARIDTLISSFKRVLESRDFDGPKTSEKPKDDPVEDSPGQEPGKEEDKKRPDYITEGGQLNIKLFTEAVRTSPELQAAMQNMDVKIQQTLATVDPTGELNGAAKALIAAFRVPGFNLYNTQILEGLARTGAVD